MTLAATVPLDSSSTVSNILKRVSYQYIVLIAVSMVLCFAVKMRGSKSNRDDFKVAASE